MFSGITQYFRQAFQSETAPTCLTDGLKQRLEALLPYQKARLVADEPLFKRLQAVNDRLDHIPEHELLCIAQEMMGLQVRVPSAVIDAAEQPIPPETGNLLHGVLRTSRYGWGEAPEKTKAKLGELFRFVSEERKRMHPFAVINELRQLRPIDNTLPILKVLELPSPASGDRAVQKAEKELIQVALAAIQGKKTCPTSKGNFRRACRPGRKPASNPRQRGHGMSCHIH